MASFVSVFAAAGSSAANTSAARIAAAAPEGQSALIAHAPSMRI
jgi:hypothetical protein